MTDPDLSTLLLQITEAGPTVTLKAVRSLMAIVIARAPNDSGPRVLRELLGLAERDAVTGPETMQ